MDIRKGIILCLTRGRVGRREVEGWEPSVSLAKLISPILDVLEGRWWKIKWLIIYPPKRFAIKNYNRQYRKFVIKSLSNLSILLAIPNKMESHLLSFPTCQTTWGRLLCSVSLIFSFLPNLSIPPLPLSY